MTGPRLTPEQLDQIQARVDATSPGPWDAARGANANGTTYANSREEKAIFLAASLNDNKSPLWLVASEEVIPAATGDGPRAKANAVFIAHARTDVPALLALVRKVQELHRPAKKWEPYEGAGYSFNTREEAIRAGGEEDLGIVAIEAGPQYFEVCKECGRIESEQLSETGEDWGYLESLYPCPTIAALTATEGV